MEIETARSKKTEEIALAIKNNNKLLYLCYLLSLSHHCFFVRSNFKFNFMYKRKFLV